MQIFAQLLKRKHPVVRIVLLVLPMIFLVALLSQTVLAQNTYVITDGDQVTVHTSYASNPETVLQEAGVELAENDFYTTADSAEGVSEITVQRELAVTIDNCGQLVTATSYGESLQTLLDRLGIQAYGPYAVSEGLDTMVYDGMEVTIRNEIKNLETYTVEIPYEVIECTDASLPAGERKVTVKGASGQMRCQAEVIYRNAEEISRVVLEETVLQAPVNEIIAVGTGEAVEEEKTVGELIIGDGYIILPTGEVLTYTHTGSFKGTAYTHGIGGVDFITATGTTVHHGTVAVDPKVIPYGTRMFIITDDGEYIYGLSTAEDCGGGVNGNHVDLYFPTVDSCFQFGVRQCTIYFLGESEIWD